MKNKKWKYQLSKSKINSWNRVRKSTLICLSMRNGQEMQFWLSKYKSKPFWSKRTQKHITVCCKWRILISLYRIWSQITSSNSSCWKIIKSETRKSINWKRYIGDPRSWTDSTASIKLAKPRTKFQSCSSALQCRSLAYLWLERISRLNAGRNLSSQAAAWSSSQCWSNQVFTLWALRRGKWANDLEMQTVTLSNRLKLSLIRILSFQSIAKTILRQGSLTGLSIFQRKREIFSFLS